MTFTFNCDIFVGIATLIMAGGLISLGWWQIRALRQQIERIDTSTSLSEKASRARLIIELDKTYNEMIDARRDVCEMWQECMAKHPTNIAECYRLIADNLANLRTSNEKDKLTRYYNVHKILDFGETIGFLVLERNLLTIEDVKGLWGTAIKTWADWLNLHIADLQQGIPDAYVLLRRLVQKL
jgi:hypothetical protein